MRLIVIVWQPLKHISAPGSKKCLGISCQAPHQLPFGDIATAQWLTPRPAEAPVYMYPIDRSTHALTFFALRSHNSETQWSICSFKHGCKALWADSVQALYARIIWGKIQLCHFSLDGWLFFLHFTEARECFDRFWSFKNSLNAFRTKQVQAIGGGDGEFAWGCPCVSWIWSENGYTERWG